MPHGGNQTFQLVKAGDVIDSQLGFSANSVIVDNYTNAYVRVTGAARDIPPNIFGAILPLNGSQVAQASLVGGTIPIPGNSAPSAVATLTFLEEKLYADSGHMIQIVSETISKRIPFNPDGSLGGPGGSPILNVPTNSTNNFTMNLPVGAQAVSLIFDNPANVLGANMNGQTTLTNYFKPFFSANITLPTNPRFAVEQDQDPQLILSVTTGLSGGTKVWASVIVDTEVVNLAQQQTPLGVSQAGNPPPWLAPTNSVRVAIRGLAAGAIQSLIGSINNARVFMHSTHVEVDQAAGGVNFEVFQVRDTSLAHIIFLAGDGANSPNRTWDHDCKGVYSGISQGIELLNSDSIAHDYSVSIKYAQAQFPLPF